MTLAYFDTMTKLYHLSKHERHEIQILHNKGYSVRERARTIGLGKTTMSNELNRTVVHNAYDAAKAQAKAV